MKRTAVGMLRFTSLYCKGQWCMNSAHSAPFWRKQSVTVTLTKNVF